MDSFSFSPGRVVIILIAKLYPVDMWVPFHTFPKELQCHHEININSYPSPITCCNLKRSLGFLADHEELLFIAIPVVPK